MKRLLCKLNWQTLQCIFFFWKQVSNVPTLKFIDEKGFMSSFIVNEWSLDMNMDVIDVVTCPHNNDFHQKHLKVCFDIID
jgi:hypothetical protein